MCFEFGGSDNQEKKERWRARATDNSRNALPREDPSLSPPHSHPLHVNWPHLKSHLLLWFWSFVFVIFFYVSFHNPVLFVFRRLFHVCTFFLFFFNIFLGVVSCLKRIFIGAILGVMFLGRTQKSVLSRDFELKDPGLCKIFRSLFRKNIDYWLLYWS